MKREYFWRHPLFQLEPRPLWIRIIRWPLIIGILASIVMAIGTIIGTALGP